MNTGRWAVVAVTLLLVCGCASQHSATTRASVSTTGPAVDPQALLSLDQIQPRPVLAPARATTQPSRPPLDAIELYARACDAQIQNMRNSAVTLIEQAIQIDPNSYELQYALGRAYLSLNSNDRAIAAFERAAEIDPDHLDVQVELGRAYQLRDDLPKAIERLRLAMQTDEYRTDDALAAVVDYRLAVALQQKGYDRAALECFSRLRNRLEHPSSSTGGAPEIGYLLNRPELVSEEIGKLHEKLGEDVEALQAYERVSGSEPNDF